MRDALNVLIEQVGIEAFDRGVTLDEIATEVNNRIIRSMPNA
jgi:hypothetical protein